MAKLVTKETTDTGSGGWAETKVFICGNFKPDVTSTAYKIQLN